jgi:hypothetical protein
MIVAKTQPSTTQPTGAVSGVPAWVSGLGQIFDNVPPQRLLGVTGPMVPIDRVTCWGAGGTNIMRASSEAMKLAAGSMMSTLDIGRVIEARNARFRPASAFGSSSNGPALAGAAANATGSDGVGRFLTEAKVTVKNRAKLPLVAGSSCHSVWIVVGDGRRAWYYLVVSDESNPQKPRTQSFVW